MHQLGIRRAPDDRVELSAVFAYEADAADVQIIHSPRPALGHSGPVVHWDHRAVVRGDLCPDNSVIVFGRVAQVRESLSISELDLG
jgi:hypothetical protein